MPSHLEVLFKEAQRQCAYKTMLIGQEINKVNMEKGEQAKHNKQMNELLNPFKVVKEVPQEKVDATWDMLRGRR